MAAVEDNPVDNHCRNIVDKGEIPNFVMIISL